ncbi:MAG: translation initiation factor IF-2 [Candidatus Nealsonbacteria bacterium CG11_big_fil_rev_8_21_14_0_20_39_9]|uniref:Translation initiation factor IF-2 n=1 Tax=Candidatus Nealsonbacteria bacterium CG11_big_fil_rev_8_21_14_0_20_39_9 TaxID=1974715 RepID=A0A2H0MPJ1_9BACT|nr:MAG: translation initiation factor IF-2 [Candidatus Nealsonbacteria bacterium CG11_big_fil_rev_8_21_14_0_20_39_9]
MEVKKEEIIIRPPVVVVLGHVDSGKTSILDYIKKTRVAEKELGGITQHVGAYQIAEGDKKITFIDTPGHEAFSAMRSRGAKVADIAILVVDTTQGVQAQTKEAIFHAKAADLPIIVALNKVDRPEAEVEKIKRELAKEEILVESLGGKIPSIETSARTGKGIKELLELISLIAEMEDLKVDLSASAQGVIVESYLDSQRGPIAILILSQGTLKAGETIGTPSSVGKIKSLEDFQKNPIREALPAQPVRVAGFEEVPKVGENFKAFANLEEAKNNLKISEKKEPPKVLEIKEGQRVLNIILKTDVLGTIEAIEEVLKELPQEKVILKILKSEAGQISESDVKLAKGGRAIVLGFRVKTSPVAQRLAGRERIKIMNFEVIYDLVEGVRKFMEKIMAPEQVRTELGKMKVLVIFLSEKNRQIVGGRVTEGIIKKGASIEVFRGEDLIGKGKMINLQRNKKDAEQVSKGEECGILYEGGVEVEEGDVLVFFTEERIKGEL